MIVGANKNAHPNPKIINLRFVGNVSIKTLPTQTQLEKEYFFKKIKLCKIQILNQKSS